MLVVSVRLALCELYWISESTGWSLRKCPLAPPHLFKIILPNLKKQQQKNKETLSPTRNSPTPQNIQPIKSSMEKHSVDNPQPQTKNTIPGLALLGRKRMLMVTELLKAKTWPHRGEVHHQAPWGSRISEKAPFILIKVSVSWPPNPTSLRETQKHPI